MQITEFRGKKVLILGLGLHGGGAGAASFFARAGAKVIVTDLKTKRDLKPALEKLARFKNIAYVLGRHRKEDIIGSDLIIKNPGVPDNSPWLKLARVHNVTVRSDIEIFFKYCPVAIVGITGTKGKSTAAYLLAEFLRKGNTRRKVFLAGNIRKSVLEILPEIGRRDLVVLELSSFQLDSLAHSRVSPKFAVITNIYPEHLNRYRNFAHYVRSKTGIFRFQKKTDRLFINRDDRLVKKISKGAESKRILVDTGRTILPFRRELDRRYAPHQKSSVALAIAVGRFLGVPGAAIAKVLKKAKPLSGRLETIRRVGGVTFINDTTATNPGSAIAALSALSKKYQGIVLIAGGAAKKLPSADFAKTIAKFARAVIFLPGSATPEIAKEVRRFTKSRKGFVEHARTMARAVKMAWRKAVRGDAVLLSPGAASFGLFQNEFDRGEQFVKAVRRLRAKENPRRP
ncbi:MAG: UDP-N-acetylmuramoyl-L-alanine--D-glutamate ligase [Candidatus Sungiibacteriota bacterium]